MTVLLTPTTRRVHGLDIARAMAMIGMVIAHYVEADAASGYGAVVRDFVDGRAMPLFMVLGGVGISFLVRRSTAPDRDLLIRATILFPMGLLLQELTTNIAVILQYYSLFFVMAIALRRLPRWALLASSVALIALGSFSKQMWAPELTSYSGWQGAGSLVDAGLWWSLVVTGYYPFLPAGAFLTLGMWLGRQDLRSRRVAIASAVAGIVLAFLGSWVGAWIGDEVGASGVVVDDAGNVALAEDLVVRYAEEEGLTTAEAGQRIANQASTSPDAVEQLADRIQRSTSGFRWERLFDTEGHSQMPAWVVGTIGTSMLVIGGSLLISEYMGLKAFAIFGEMALTFYAFQAIAINWTPLRSTTTTTEEYLIVVGLSLFFMVFALGWKRTAGRGPLEQLLRVGSAPRTGG